MKPWVHFVTSLILAAVLYPLFEWKVLIIFISGILIDIDHYFWSIYKYKNFNLFDCYRYFIVDEVKNNFKNITGGLLIFHTIEFLVIAVLLSFFIEGVLIFTIGLIIHYIIDLKSYYFVPKRLVVNHSIISWIMKNKIQKSNFS